MSKPFAFGAYDPGVIQVGPAASTMSGLPWGKFASAAAPYAFDLAKSYLSGGNSRNAPVVSARRYSGFRSRRRYRRRFRRRFASNTVPRKRITIPNPRLPGCLTTKAVNVQRFNSDKTLGTGTSAYRYVIYGNALCPWPVFDPPQTWGATYSPTPPAGSVIPEKFLQLADVYGKCRVNGLAVDIEMTYLNGESAISWILLPCAPDIGASATQHNVNAAVVHLDSLSFSQVASLPGARYGTVPVGGIARVQMFRRNKSFFCLSSNRDERQNENTMPHDRNGEGISQPPNTNVWFYYFKLFQTQAVASNISIVAKTIQYCDLFQTDKSQGFGIVPDEEEALVATPPVVELEN